MITIRKKAYEIKANYFKRVTKHFIEEGYTKHEAHKLCEENWDRCNDVYRVLQDKFIYNSF